MHSELIARLEAAGPDRELDAAIKELVGHEWDYAADWGPRGFEEPVAHPYTASIEAALTLVPEGWTYVSLEICARGLPTQHCRVSIERMIGEDDQVGVCGHAAKPALAIAAAALRAKDTTHDG
jgi:hypothetical protein